MTTVIDERVVEMRFNNEDFEKNVAQSMKTLEDLKSALKFEGGAKSLEEIGKAAKNFSLTGITETISEASSKFSVLEVAGITAIAKITNSIMDMGTQLVKSLSVDQVSMGFNKYADKTTAIQTIMAATAKQYGNQNEQLKDINAQMDKLMWFTDETSYNFVDMVSNIGKFTSNNIGLEESVTAMQGIANWAAKSGQNAQTASRAMYNIAQAMGSGAMKVADWRSIELANMTTFEFKETAAKTAVELGRLKEVSDGLYETMDGHQFTLEQFREQLKDGWFDKDVMMETFAVYGGFTNILYDLSEATDLTASELLQNVEEYKEGHTEFIQELANDKISVEELTEAFDKLASEENEIGRTAFQNAQEAKTFGEVIDSVKDAVSTKWSETFELLFGNYLEAKRLWTGLANDLWTVFAESGDERNEVLSVWKELGGRTELITGLVHAVNLLVKPLGVVKQAFKDMFPEDLGSVLYNLTKRFRELMESLQPSNEVLSNVYRTFKGLFTLGKMLGQVFLALVKAIVPAARPFGSLIEMILTFTGYVGVFIEVISSYADEMGIFEAITNGLIGIFGTLLQAIKTVATVIGTGLLIAGGVVVKVFSTIIGAITKFIQKTQPVKKAIDAITKAVNRFKDIFSKAEKPVEKMNKVVVDAEKYFAAATKTTAEFGTVMNDTGEQSKKALTPLQKVVNVIKLVVSVLGLAVTAIVKLIVKLWEKIKEFFTDLGERVKGADEDKNAFVAVFEALFDKIKEVLGNCKDAIKEFFDNLGINTDGIKDAFDTINGFLSTFLDKMTGGKIVAIALSIALLALVGSAIDLSSKIGALSSAMSGFFTNINKILKKQFLGPVNFLTDLAKAFALVAGSLALLMYVDKDGTKIIKFAATMGGLILVLTILAGVIEKLSNKFAAVNEVVEGFNGMSKTIIALAGSILIISAAMAVLSQIPSDDMFHLFTKLSMAIAALGAVAVIAVEMSHVIGPATAGAAVILALAIALRQIAKAMAELSEIPIENITGRWKEYAAMFGGISAMLAASSLINIRNALGLILTAKALEMLIPQLKILVQGANSLPGQEFIQSVLNKLTALEWFISGLLGLITIIKIVELKVGKFKNPAKFTGLFSGIGGVFAGLGTAVFLITLSVKKMHEMSKELQPGELKKIGLFIGAIIGVLTLCTGLLMAAHNFAHRKFPVGFDLKLAQLGVMMMALAVAVRIIASATKVVAEVNRAGGMWGAVIAIGALGTILAIIVSLAGEVPKAIPAMAALITATIAMGLLIGELAVLSLLVESYKDDMFSLGIAMVAMAGIFVGMTALMNSMHSMYGIKAGPIFSLALVIVAIGGLFAAITLLTAYHPDKAVFALGGVIIVFVMLDALFKTLNATTIPSGNTIGAMIAIVLALGVLGVSLAEISKNDWASIAMSGLAMTGCIIAIAGALKILGGLGSGPELMAAALAADMLSLSMIAIAKALEIIKGMDAGDIAAKVLATIGIVSGLVAIAGIISAISGETVAIGMIAFAGSVLVLAGAFAIFATFMEPMASGLEALTTALTNFATVPFLDISTGLSNLSGGLFTIGLAGVVLGLGVPGLVGGAFALGLLGDAAAASVDSLNSLAAVDLYHIAGGLAAIGAAGAAMGLFAPLILAGAVAVGIFGGSLLLLKAGFDAIEGAFEWFSASMESFGNSIANTLDGVKQTFANFFPDLGALFTGADASSVVKQGTLFGHQIGGEKGSGEGIVGGFSEATQYASPPGFILDFFAACSEAFGMNGGAVSAATQSGGQIGDAFGSSFFEKASAWFSNLGASISSWWSGVVGSFGGGSIKIENDLDSMGAASEKFAQRNGKSVKQSGSFVDQLRGKWNSFTSDMKNGMEKTRKEWDLGAKVENYVKDITDDVTESMEKATESTGGFGDAVEGAGGKAKKAAEDMKDLRDSLVDTLSSQLDMFSKFELKMGVSADQMIENMKSNIDGFASWSHRMTVLAERFAEHGISDTLYKKLAELGPKGYETMNAFYQMTDEQLEEVRGLWETGLTLPEGQADIVAAGFQYMGEMSAEGFSNALDEHKAAHAGSMFGKSALRGIAEALAIHSPSKETEKLGQFAVEGLAQGIDSVYGQGILYFAVKHVTDYLLELFNENLSEDVMAEAGTGILTNLFTGILGEATEENPVMAAFIQTFTEFELIDEALNLFVEHLKELLYELFEIPGDEEPSEWFKRYAMSMLQGMINSFIENEVLLRVQIIMLAMHIMETWNEQDLPQQFYDAGRFMVEGLANGMLENMDIAVEAALAVGTACVEAMARATQESSPSKLTMQIGRYVSEGLAIGIEDGADNVYKAASSVAEGSIDAMSNMGRLQDVISEGLDFNPVITPMLDLSLIREQMAELDSLMNDPTYGLEGQNGGEASAKSPSQINFTQNNYSPKALSRIEIYRQTKNQISQLKGALG